MRLQRRSQALRVMHRRNSLLLRPDFHLNLRTNLLSMNLLPPTTLLESGTSSFHFE
jgi:hypothetical protein